MSIGLRVSEGSLADLIRGHRFFGFLTSIAIDRINTLILDRRFK